MILTLPFFFIFIFITASVHAMLEIQVEGPHGWAKNLPTKIIQNRFVARFAEVGYITGFHIATVALVAILAHFPLFFVKQWSIQLEVLVICFIIFHFVFEDFLWFVYNPSFGIKKFSAKYIWWHKNWALGVPISYIVSLFVGIMLLIIFF